MAAEGVAATVAAAAAVANGFVAADTDAAVALVVAEGVAAAVAAAEAVANEFVAAAAAVVVVVT